MKKCLKAVLSGSLPPESLADVCNSYDIIGDIAIIRSTALPRKFGENVAEAIIKTHRNVKTVLAQTSPVDGDFRLRGLAYIAGEKRTKTVYAESGCRFLVDVERCYSRLGSFMRENELRIKSWMMRPLLTCLLA